MGIPGFNSRTLSCAKLQIIGKRDDYPHTLAVIDGPALAYDAFHQVQDESITPKSYAEIRDAMLSRLNQLELHGVQIAGIIFDGALPYEKLSERVGRFENYYATLLKAKSTTSSKSLQYDSIQGSRLGKISPAFLVSSAYEELISSSYGKITFMVPGEADPFIVLAAIEASESRQVIIFTSDSDLLLYKPRSNVQVAYLNAIEEVYEDSKSYGSLQARVFRPAAFPDEMKIDDILKPAFLMEQDRHLPLRQAIKRANDRSGAMPYAFTEFTARYNLPTRFDAYDSQILVDVRLRELIHQIDEGSGKLRIFLPPLIEDVGRGTGWYICRDLRLLTYSILALRSESRTNTSLTEYSRRGVLCRPDLVHLFDRGSIADHLLKCHLSLLESLSTVEKSLGCILTWRFVGLVFLYEDFEKRGKPLPDVNVGLRLLMNNPSPSDWMGVHLQAQHQAVLYSFRMLKQVCHAVDHWGLGDTGTTQPGADSVGTKLRDMPGAGAIAATEDKLWQQIRATNSLLSDLPKLSLLMDACLTRNDREMNDRCVKLVHRLHSSLRPIKSTNLNEQATPTNGCENAEDEPVDEEVDDRLGSNNPFAILQRSRMK